MSWSCPYELNRYCKRLKKPCQPGIKGCILAGQVEFIDENRDRPLESVREVNKTMNENIQTLDLRPMPPFERHEKIFQVWDTLKSGDVLMIINDHDPKPLWYQFEVEYKDKYEWEYEQKGPEDWIVKIKRR